MNRQELFNQIKTKRSFLCVGLDTDTKKIPQFLLEKEDPIYAFNKAIIDATAPYCIAYKPNLAFYEAFGIKGMIAFEKTIKYLNDNYPNHFIIADAKRGDIGNTSAMYARTFFEEYKLDARIKGGERHIIMSGEYDSVLPMDIYGEYLIKAIITGDIDKQEQLGIYEVSPEDFALAEFVDSSKLELQRIVREGLDVLRKENE